MLAEHIAADDIGGFPLLYEASDTWLIGSISAQGRISDLLLYQKIGLQEQALLGAQRHC